ELRARPKVTPVTTVAALVRRNDRVLVAQVPKDAARSANMWQFPNVDLLPDETVGDAARRALLSWCGIDGQAKTVRSLGKSLESEPAPYAEVKHSVTRYRITLKLIELTTRQEPQAR